MAIANQNQSVNKLVLTYVMQEGGVAAQGGAFPSLMQSVLGKIPEDDKYKTLLGNRVAPQL